MFTALLPVALEAGTSTAATTDYSAIANQVGSQINGMTSAATPMILAALGGGLAVFAIFLLFRLGKRAISAATSSRG